ncbi:DUF1376 domain-containing protein [Bartonella queenslandensis]|uniref:DUF1376 domain-containing protein n=1 Tax=Bartonella queenslandensis TaxID=481138 RepID=UPI000585C515|nr:DUF1376 domain-containing protein [Bartonella queenslandensis]
MSTKLVWVRSFPSDCLAETNGMKAFQIATYVTLKWHMRKNGEPIFYDQDKLAHSAGCSKKIFNKAVEFLIRDKKIICLEDGRLWSLQVEEELNNSNENLNKFSERAQRAAKARWEKSQDNNEYDANNAKHDAKAMLNDAKHDANSNAKAMLNDANHNHNHNHIYNKKTNTIVLAKKEIDFENLEITDFVEEPIEVDVVESQSEQIATSSENQLPIHEQENVLKKTKRVKTDRGCRLPADFEPDYDFAIREGLPPERVKVEIAKFRDYWNAKAGKDASKRDWQATWRNWVRNSKDHKVNKQGANYGHYTQKQKSIGERIADSILDIGNRGYFESHSRDDSTGIPIGFERWQPTNETAGSDCFRGW